MSTQLDTDIAVLVGELAEVQCEHSQHGEHPSHTDQPASHYIRGRCPGCSPVGRVYPACPGFVMATMLYEHLVCPRCQTKSPTNECFTILGPVNK